MTALASELIEPVLAKAVGLIHYEWDRSAKDEAAARRYYYNVNGLNRFTICNNENGVGVHASLAMNNVLRGVASIIEDTLKRCPITERW